MTILNKKQKALDNYIRCKHNQDECSGFIDGYEKAETDLSKSAYYILALGLFIGILIGLLF